jgi:hypothetical protein
MMAKLHFLIINGLYQPLSKASYRDFLLKGRYKWIVTVRSRPERKR